MLPSPALLFAVGDELFRVGPFCLMVTPWFLLGPRRHGITSLLILGGFLGGMALAPQGFCLQRLCLIQATS